MPDSTTGYVRRVLLLNISLTYTIYSLTSMKRSTSHYQTGFLLG